MYPAAGHTRQPCSRVRQPRPPQGAGWAASTCRTKAETRVDGRAVADLVSVPAQMPAVTSSAVCADDLPDGLVITDRAGRVTVFNRAATRLTGVLAPAALGGD